MKWPLGQLCACLYVLYLQAENVYDYYSIYFMVNLQAINVLRNRYGFLSCVHGSIYVFS